MGMLGESLEELDETLKENVHVSDVPEKWKKGMHNLLHVRVHNKEDIADVWDDVEDSKVVRNLGDSLKEWAHSDEVGAIKKLDQIEKETFTNDDELYINNKHLDQLTDRMEDLGEQYESLEKSKWGKVY